MSNFERAVLAKNKNRYTELWFFMNPSNKDRYRKSANYNIRRAINIANLFEKVAKQKYINKKLTYNMKKLENNIKSFREKRLSNRIKQSKRQTVGTFIKPNNLKINEIRSIQNAPIPNNIRKRFLNMKSKVSPSLISLLISSISPKNARNLMNRPPIQKTTNVSQKMIRPPRQTGFIFTN